MGGKEKLSSDTYYDLVKEAQRQINAMREGGANGETLSWRDVYAPVRQFNEAWSAQRKAETSEPKHEAKAEAERSPIAREAKREIGATALDSVQQTARRSEAYQPRHMRAEQPVEPLSPQRPDESIDDYIDRMVKEEVANDDVRRKEANYQPRHMRPAEAAPVHESVAPATIEPEARRFAEATGRVPRHINNELDRSLPSIERTKSPEQERAEQGEAVYAKTTYDAALAKTVEEHPVSESAAQKINEYEEAKENHEDVSFYRFTDSDTASVNNYLIQQGANGHSMEELKADAKDLLPESELFRDIDHPDDAVHKGITEFHENLRKEREPEVDSEVVRKANHMAAELATPHGRIEGFLAERAARREQREADEAAGYTDLPGYKAVIRGRKKYDQLDKENTYKRGWDVKSQEYNREYSNAVDELMLQYFMNMPAETSDDEKQARINELNQRFNVRKYASDKDRENGTDMITPISLARLEHEAGVRRAAEHNGWNIIDWAKFHRSHSAESERDHEKRNHMTTAQKVVAGVAACALSATVLGVYAQAQANNAPADTISYAAENDNQDETAGDTVADQGLNGETKASDTETEATETESGVETMEARHYTADNLPALDHHMWNSPNKRSATAFTAEVDTSSREATYTHFMEACESMPEQLSIFANTLLSPEQAKQLGLTGDNNADADLLTTNNEMRANVLNAVSDALFSANTNYDDVTLNGNYVDYGIRQDKDGGFTLIDGQTNLTGQEAIQITNGEDGVMVVIKACDNVVQKVAGQIRVVKRGAIQHTTTTTNTTTTTETGTPGTPNTPDTPDTPPNTPDTPDTPPDTPDTPDTPPDVPVVPKADSQIGEENGNPHVTVNEEEGNVDNPTGVTEHHERGGNVTSSEEATASESTTSTEQATTATQPTQTATTGTSSEPVTVSQNQTPQQRVEQIYQEEVARANGNAEAAQTTTNAPVSGGETYQEAETHVGESTGMSSTGETVDQAQETVTTGFNAEQIGKGKEQYV